MSDVNRAVHVKPLNELEARRAVAGLDVDIIEKMHVTPAEADAITVALRHFLTGDEPGARAILQNTFMNGTVDRILAEFAQIADADAAA